MSTRSWRLHVRAASAGAVAGALLTLSAHVLAGDRRGTDDAARETATQLAPQFEPWAQPLIEISDGAQLPLFVVQGMLGGALLSVSVAVLRRGRFDAS
ncbi:MAG: energy-coupling factor ABC transporter substrate-binding protein [Gemmatimonadetes bacterium]|nr:energy-coupling factor ABC transporter substrate-binding protein [Gemmatimonadota bacterium]